MIDFDDADDMAMLGWFFDGPVGLIIAIVAVVFYMVACQNETDCKTKSCPVGMKAELMHHECLCAMEAK